MAHFAEIDESNVVLRVIVVSDLECKDSDGNESEEVGALFCANLFGGTWKQTSYNARIRKNYASIGAKFDAEKDAFIPPQPFAGWVMDEETCQWKAPNSPPDDGNLYYWDEPTQSWVSSSGATQ
jgi:hypothetical protein